MNLLKDSLFSIRWLLAVMRAFMRVRPVTTTGVGLLSIVAMITGLLATFLPLKVIILVGSDGVPRYFRAFMGSESGDRMDWIIALAIAAVASFVVTLILDAIVSHLSEKASMDVLSGANEMAVASNMRSEAQTYYSRFLEVGTSFAFGLIGIGALAFLNMTLFMVVAALMLAQFVFSAVVLDYSDPHRPGPLRRLVTSRIGGYLGALSTINFLIGFLTILASYLMGIADNILIAILSIIVMRRCFGAIASAISGLVALTKRRPVINPLVFRQQTAKPKETATNRSLRELFRKPERERLAAGEIEKALGKPYKVSVRWTDSRIGGINIFDVEATDPDSGETRFLQQQVFPAKSLHLLEKEDFLFSMLSRDSLDAAEVVARFSHGPFECQLLEYGQGKEPPSDVWAEMLLPMILDHWGFKPPEKLVAAFRTGKSMLSARLRRDFVNRISVAVDSPEERQRYKALMNALPGIGAVVDRVPLYIFNPDFTRTNMAWNRDGSASVMTWGRWSIAPIGAKPLDRFDDTQLAEMIAEVARRRNDVPKDLSPAHLRFVGSCYELERNINKEDYKAALKVAASILASPVLELGGADTEQDAGNGVAKT